MSDLIALPLAPRRQLTMSSTPLLAQRQRRWWKGRSGTAERKRERRSPSFDEVLPHVVLELIRVRQLLDEVLDRVLPEAKEVGTRDRVRMRTIADVIRCPHDDGPRARSSPGDDRLVGGIGCCDLELRAISTVEDFAVVHNL